MKAVIQRVTEARLDISGKPHSHIGAGMVVLLGIHTTDTLDDVEYLCKKLSKLRIFDDDAGVMNRDLSEVGGEILLVSQFTLHAETRKGNRPSYIQAARPEVARPLYEAMITKLGEALAKPIQTGIFGADMQIYLCNDGPVTILIDTHNK